jgi:hypothetical protein
MRGMFAFTNALCASGNGPPSTMGTDRPGSPTMSSNRKSRAAESTTVEKVEEEAEKSPGSCGNEEDVAAFPSCE